MHSQKGFSFRDLSELWLRVKQTDDCSTLSLFGDWQRAHAARAAASEEPSREREKARIMRRERPSSAPPCFCRTVGEDDPVREEDWPILAKPRAIVLAHAVERIVFAGEAVDESRDRKYETRCPAPRTKPVTSQWDPLQPGSSRDFDVP